MGLYHWSACGHEPSWVEFTARFETPIKKSQHVLQKTRLFGNCLNSLRVTYVYISTRHDKQEIEAPIYRIIYMYTYLKM